MNKRKGVSTKISPNDQSLVNYVYYNYDPAEIESFKFTLTLGTTYLKGAKAGEIHMKPPHDLNSADKSEYNNLDASDRKVNVISFLDTGSLNSISSNLEKVPTQEGDYYVVKSNVQKKSILELFQMKLCEHLPQETVISRLLEQQKKYDTKKAKNRRKMQKFEPIFCKHCSQRLFYFYLPDYKKINLGDVLVQIDVEDETQEIPKIEWNVMLGETFTKTTAIAKLDDKQFFLQQNGKISFLASWSEIDSSKLQSLVLKYKPIYCQHEKIQSNICQYCFEQVDPFELNLKKFLFQMEEEDNFKREMITTGSTLTEQQNKFVDNLIEKERGILILDLDNTVLHSIELGQIHKSRLQEMEEFYELKLGSAIQFNREIGLHFITSCFIVKMRPYFKEFIETVIRYYEIYVYTKGTRMYAEQICHAIRNQYASKEHFTINKNNKLQYCNFLKDKNAFTPSRIITRDQDPDLERKSLNNILPTRQQNLMVMDDLRSVWNYSSAVLLTVPYHFFFKSKHLDALNQKQNNRIIKINGNALDQSKQGQRLEPVQDLHAQNLEPVRELPCDHFDREVFQLQNNIVEPVIEHPVDHFKKQIAQIEKNPQILELGNKQQIRQGDLVAEISMQDNLVEVVDIKKGLAPEDKQYDYDILPRPDFYLIYASWNLVQIHQRFFDENKLQKSGEKRLSFSQVHRKLKSQILQGTVIKMCMKNQTKIDIYGRAITLGCKVVEHDSQATPHYIIRLNNLKSNMDRMHFKKEQESERKSIQKQQVEIEKETIKQLKFYSQTLKIPIVSESWIEFCYSFTYKFPVEPFIIDSDYIFNEIHQEDYEWIIEQHAKKLLQNIRKENEAYQKQKEKEGTIE